MLKKPCERYESPLMGSAKITPLSALEIIAVILAGFGAGTINAVIGSGTLITFPVLLAIGYPPVVANVSNNVGLVPGAVSSAWGYRDELKGSRSGGQVCAVHRRRRRGGLGPPASAARIGLQGDRPGADPDLARAGRPCSPGIKAAIEARRTVHRPHGGRVLLGGIFGTGVYGGYFGAAQGILLFSLLASSIDGELTEINDVRAILAGIANLVAAIVFLFIADIAWLPGVLIALGSTAGGLFGAGIGKRLPDPWLRAIIVVVGLAAIAQIVQVDDNTPWGCARLSPWNLQSR